MNRKSAKKKKHLLQLTAVAVVTAVVCALLWANTAVELNTVKIASSRIPQAFNGFRIAHLSDIHNARFGENNNKLLSLLESAQADIIVITGDLVDAHRPDIDTALQFIEQAVKIAPCYFVTGNHEAWIDDYSPVEAGLTANGVTVLHDSEVILERSAQRISLLGIDDPDFADKHGGIATGMQPCDIARLNTTGGFSVLLTHRPEFFGQYSEAGIDLVLCGHAHGGQVRLPFVGGLYAPNQGLFPEYDAGLFESGQTAMLVSRGIGNSIIPLRINDRPEIVIIELQSAA